MLEPVIYGRSEEWLLKKCWTLWERDVSDVNKIIKNKIILKFEIVLCNLYSQIRYKMNSNITHRVQLKIWLKKKFRRNSHSGYMEKLTLFFLFPLSLQRLGVHFSWKIRLQVWSFNKNIQFQRCGFCFHFRLSSTSD